MGRMYVVMGEHHDEADVYGDVWALLLPGQGNASTSNGHAGDIRGGKVLKSAVFTLNCNVCNTNATYIGSKALPG